MVERERDMLEVGGSTPSAPIPPLAHYAPLAWDESYGRCTVALCGAEILGIDAFEPYQLCAECERIWESRMVINE